MYHPLLSEITTSDVQFYSSERHLFPIQDLYVCDHCSKLISKYELDMEYEGSFCRQCYDLRDSVEKKLTCERCFDCPKCFTSLQLRKRVANNTSSKSSECYFFCNYCHWDSTNLMINGDTPNDLSSNAIERQRVLHDEFDQLKAHYKKKAEYCRNAASEVSRRRVGKVEAIRFHKTMSGPKTKSRKQTAVTVMDKFMTIEEIENGSFVDSEDFMHSIDSVSNYDEIASFVQRLRNCVEVKRLTESLSPIQTRLLPRRSKRCEKCLHLVVKSSPTPQAPILLDKTALNYFPYFQVATSGSGAIQFRPNQRFNMMSPLCHDKTMWVDLEVINTCKQKIVLQTHPPEESFKQDTTIEVTTPNAVVELREYSDTYENDEVSWPRIQKRRDNSTQRQDGPTLETAPKLESAYYSDTGDAKQSESDSEKTPQVDIEQSKAKLLNLKNNACLIRFTIESRPNVSVGAEALLALGICVGYTARKKTVKTHMRLNLGTLV